MARVQQPEAWLAVILISLVNIAGQQAATYDEFIFISVGRRGRTLVKRRRVSNSKSSVITFLDVLDEILAAYLRLAETVQEAKVLMTI